MRASSPPDRDRLAGAALVIVLAFVVLLTGLIVAFFSQAISERQISNSSASQAKVSLFADGSISSIVGDLKSEIAAGSTPTPVTTTGAVPPTVTIYAPKSAANAVPQRVGKTDYPVMDAWPNLIKVSTDKEPFYTNGPTRAINLASSAPSQNGRYVSPKRWNSHYLLPKKLANADGSPNYTDPTPVDGNQVQQNFAPKWILAASDGTNPTAPGTSVVGRYAYAIYDEGGLLDLNAAGFPVPTNYPGTPAPLNYGYKASEAFADLSQLTDASGNALLTPTQIDAIVGRRNFVSAAINPSTNTQTPLSGTFPAFTWASANLTNYFLYGLTDGSGFLAPTQLPQLNNDPSAYDRKVLTRQEMMGLLLRGLVTSTDPATAGAQRANIQNALQYITNYTRDLNQPSYMPVSRVSSSTNPNPRPTILASASGGNNAGDGTMASDQDKLSPSFLTVRAEAAFTRNDGTLAVVGDPLVKSRFALQRLAWLTYAGPITPDGTTYNANLDPSYVATLKSTYGFTDAYLLKGKPQTVQQYFGLTWNGTEWAYNVDNRSGTKGAIRQLQEIADLKTREPDFFELLKASIDPASLGKASTNSPLADPSPGGGLAPLNFEYLRDIAVDAAIIQIGANIVDQFDLDGFPTRILFDDGSGRGAREFRGVENLPYIYRVHPVGLKARDAIPSAGQDPNVPAPTLFSNITGSPTQTFFDTGVGILLAIPDLWNPHDQNSSLGSPRPGGTVPSAGAFRVIANSATPDNIFSGSGTYSTITVGGFAHSPANGDYKGNSFDPANPGGGGALAPTSVTPNAPGFSRTPTPTGGLGTPMTGGFNNPQYINPSTSSVLTFNVPDATVFREPTMLAEPGVAGTGLKMLISNPDITGLQNTATSVYDTTKYGLRSINTNPFSRAAGTGSGTGEYTGIYLGVYPLCWVGARWSTSDRTSTGWVYTDANIGVSGGPVDGITYALQYQDATSGSWVTYDEKYLDVNAFWVNPVDGSFLQSRLQEAPSQAFCDPRTSRFGSPPESDIASATATMNRYRAPTASVNWLDAANCVAVSERPDYHSGFGMNYRGTYGAVGSQVTDWGAYTALGWHYRNLGMNTTGNGAYDIFLQTGLFAQNNPYFTSDGFKYAGDTIGVGGSDAQFYSDADGVVRRGMAGNISLAATSLVGQPLATASAVSGGKASPSPQSLSRPKILNRPFRSVAELGYVFTGNPWKNLDFSTPESGDSALLDVFCVNEATDASGLVAGRLDLNTRQTKVLDAMLVGAYSSEASAGPTPFGFNDADAVANLLTKRTTAAPASGKSGPLINIGDLAGKWVGKQAISNWNNSTVYSPTLNASHNIDGSASYDGFSADLEAQYTASPATMNVAYSPATVQRETAVRALASVGNTRVWNLLIDVVAQTGRYPAGTTSVNNFIVEGEQRCWAHVAIDRCTGQVIDSKLEVVKE